MTRRSLSRPWPMLVVAALLLGACGSAPASPAAPSPNGVAAVPTSTAEPTPEPTAAPTPTPTPTPTASPAPTPAPTTAPTPTPEPIATPRPTPSPGLPTGRTGTVTVEEVGLSLALPKGWRSIGLTEKDIKAIIKTLPAGTLPAGFEDQVGAMVQSGLRLMAVDTQRANLGANVTVLVLPLGMSSTLVRSSAELALAQVPGIGNVRMTDTVVDGADGLRVDYALKLTVAGTTVRATGAQVWILLPSSTAIVTVTTPKGGQPEDRDRIIRSLSLD